ncbi:hypothetical protein GA0070564_10122 [Micromonospora mirobrigensis]|uniref:Ferritin-like domain-containing protein n=1 Tax=Micromonospora mirobrigensis TaxID=262898 RepID=A0A1C4TX14_9ACTN|nr:hypothetical protein GA0070564_10122 [Micromonospora mirobrigensis]
MVLTCPVATGRTTQRDETTGHSRRNLLRAGALLALGGAPAPLAGCDLFDRGDDPPPAPDPLEPLVAGALELAGRHRAALAADPGLAERLTPIAEAHEAHAAELRRVIGRTPPSGSPSPTPGASAPTTTGAALVAELRAAERTGQVAAAKACATAPAERAALLGSIAAARATHVEVLG